MPLDKPVYQLAMDLDGIEEAVQDDLHLSTEEVRRRSENGMTVLAALKVKDPESGIEKAPRWYELCKRLQDGGWPWRVAVYISWAAMPRKYRWPETQEELAIRCMALNSDR